MADVEYRRFQPGDVAALVELMALGLPTDPVSLEWFTEYVLLDPNFDADGLTVATGCLDEQPFARTLGSTVEELLGFVYAVRARGGAGIPVDPDGGWITIGAVHPAARRRGIGSGLLTRAVDFLRSRGAKWVAYSGYPPAYFLPGLDADAYPEALRLFEAHGFRTRYRPVAMDLGLATYRIPDDVLARQRTRESEGYTFAPATPGDLPEAIAFAAAELAPDWGEAIREAVLRHGRPERVVVVRDPDQTIVGVATYGAYRGVMERFGPIGVAPTQRGLGLGKILMHVTLARMRAEGAHSAWFLWTGLESPAGRLYLEAGFVVTRTFHVLQIDLDT